jgi:hypothetical protein
MKIILLSLKFFFAAMFHPEKYFNQLFKGKDRRRLIITAIKYDPACLNYLSMPEI